MGPVIKLFHVKQGPHETLFIIVSKSIINGESKMAPINSIGLDEVYEEIQKEFNINPENIVKVLELEYGSEKIISVKVKPSTFIGKQLLGEPNGACLGTYKIDSVYYIFWDAEKYGSELEGLHGRSN